jgi:hypothetical protein
MEQWCSDYNGSIILFVYFVIKIEISTNRLTLYLSKDRDSTYPHYITCETSPCWNHLARLKDWIISIHLEKNDFEKQILVW